MGEDCVLAHTLQVEEDCVLAHTLKVGRSRRHAGPLTVIISYDNGSHNGSARDDVDLHCQQGRDVECDLKYLVVFKDTIIFDEQQSRGSCDIVRDTASVAECC